jgi:uncharacterized protein (TIGR03435 family)
MKWPETAALVWLTACVSPGQSVLSLPQFDAASVKPSSPGDIRGSTFEFIPGGGLRITNGTLRGILETAYSVRDFQIVGGPGWLNSDQWEIYARSNPGGPSDIAETRRKLQALLAQRFQLKAHREIRELPIYALVVAKGGSKLATVPSQNAEGSVAGIHAECGRMTGTMTSIKNLTVYLERQVRRPVVDRTGLTGRYDFQLDWESDAGPCAASAVDGAARGAGGDSSDGPSLFTALQEKLGLKLESTRGPVEVIVVDRADKADDN